MFYHFDTTRAAGQSETESFLMHPAAPALPPDWLPLALPLRLWTFAA
jgi:hypothetical protein